MPLVLTFSTGMDFVSASRDSARVAWKPFMPGRITSISTRSGCSRRQTSIPSSALPEASTSWPLRSSSWVRTAVSFAESSIRRIRAIDCLPPRSGVAYVRANRVEEFLAREWLGQVLLGAYDATPRLVEQPILGRKHDDRCCLESLVVLDQRTRLVAIQPRHHDVDEDDLRLRGGGLGEGFGPLGRCDHFAAFAFEQRLGGAPDGLGVIDHHDPQPGQTAA